MVEYAYKHKPGFMTSFNSHGQRQGRHFNAEKFFNHHYFALRSDIEHSFGAWKDGSHCLGVQCKITWFYG